MYTESNTEAAGIKCVIQSNTDGDATKSMGYFSSAENGKGNRSAGKKRRKDQKRTHPPGIAFIHRGAEEREKVIRKLFSMIQKENNYPDGKTKGNCDAELVLQAMIEYPNYNKAMIVTGDGDFYCLVKYLIEKSKLMAIIIPNKHKFSALLNFKICRPFLRFMNDLKIKLEYKKEKAP